MKTQNKMRMTAAVVGLGAALLFAGTVRAQQEIDPTHFDVNPGTPAVQPAPVRTAQASPAAQKSRDTESAVSIATGKDTTLEAGLTRVALMDGAIAVIFLGGFASIVFYAVAATKREYVPDDLSCNAAARYHTVSATPVQ